MNGPRIGGEPIPHSVLRRIRDRLRAGEGAHDIAASMVVSRTIVNRQSMLLRFANGMSQQEAEAQGKREGALRMRKRRSSTYAESAGDLVDIIQASLSPGQLAYWTGGDE